MYEANGWSSQKSIERLGHLKEKISSFKRRFKEPRVPPSRPYQA